MNPTSEQNHHFKNYAAKIQFRFISSTNTNYFLYQKLSLGPRASQASVVVPSFIPSPVISFNIFLQSLIAQNKNLSVSLIINIIGCLHLSYNVNPNANILN